MSNILAVTYEAAFTPTQSNTVDDPAGPFAAFYVGVTGDVKVTTLSGQDVVFKNVQQGTGIPVAHRRVWVTGTTASSILSLVSPPYKHPVST